MTDADAHAIAGDALKSYFHQHVADVLHLIVETHDDRTHPSLVRNGTHIFNRQLIKVMSAVFGCRRDCRSIRLRVQLLREKHDASAIVGAPAHRLRDRLESFHRGNVNHRPGIEPAHDRELAGGGVVTLAGSEHLGQ